MSNDYFQFKQFLIKQDKCAMKVCTDACLFGAWAANRINNEKLIIKNCLDIGTGTGLLSLMLAQKNPGVNVDAVDIDEAAATQAKENFHNSLWKERLNVYTNSIQEFASLSKKKYDFIISNPPFYENDLKSVDTKRNLALHSNALSLEELLSNVRKLLADEGSFFVLLPFHRVNESEELLLKNNLFVKEKVLVKQTTKHNYFRCMFWISNAVKETIQPEIIIMNEKNEYSKEFKELLSGYYLKL